MLERSSIDIASDRAKEYEDFQKLKEEYSEIFKELSVRLENLGQKHHEVSTRMVRGLQSIANFEKDMDNVPAEVRGAIDNLRQSIAQYSAEADAITVEYAELNKILQTQQEVLRSKQEALKKHLH